jgi:hypothetical protein
MATWLPAWLSRPPKGAGMEGNRTHPGRLSSAPQTVLKTAALAPRAPGYRGLRFDPKQVLSAIVRPRPLTSVGLAVNDHPRHGTTPVPVFGT